MKRWTAQRIHETFERIRDQAAYKCDPHSQEVSQKMVWNALSTDEQDVYDCFSKVVNQLLSSGISFCHVECMYQAFYSIQTEYGLYPQCEDPWYQQVDGDVPYGSFEALLKELFNVSKARFRGPRNPTLLN